MLPRLEHLMILREEREEHLSPAALTLAAEMEGGIVTFEEHVWFFCREIGRYGIKPWGRLGRRHLLDAAHDLVKTGAFDALHTCRAPGCHRTFLMKTDDPTVDLIVDGYRRQSVGDENDYCRCSRCGGIVEHFDSK
jgi:hypothetical protein